MTLAEVKQKECRTDAKMEPKGNPKATQSGRKTPKGRQRGAKVAQKAGKMACQKGGQKRNKNGCHKVTGRMARRNARGHPLPINKPYKPY